MTSKNMSVIVRPRDRQCRLIVSVIQLQLEAGSVFDQGADRCVNDAARGEAHLHVVADFELAWGWVGLFRHDGIAR